MPHDFDLSRLSNAGKEAARVHKQLRKTAERIKAVTDEALAAGVPPWEIDQAMFKFCSTSEQLNDAASLFLAMNQIAKRKSESES